MKKFISIFILIITAMFAHASAFANTADTVVIEHDLIGSVYVNTPFAGGIVYASNPYVSSDGFAVISLTSTVLSMLTTTLTSIARIDPMPVAATITGGYVNEDKRISIDAVGLLMFIGSFAASIAGYDFGLKNDIFAIVPVCPVVITQGTEHSFGFIEAEKYRLQYGLYFYFSKDF